MGDWSNPSLRTTGLVIRPLGAAEAAEAAPGPAELVVAQHVSVTYDVVLANGRVVHSGALTIHGPAGDGRALPDDLAAAVELLLAHAEQVAAKHEGLEPA